MTCGRCRRSHQGTHPWHRFDCGGRFARTMSSPTSATSAAHETGAQDQQRSPVDPASRTTKGVILRHEEGVAIFRPIDTSYEHHLAAPASFSAEVGRNVRAVIRVNARKVYTVMSGGNFVQPILGQP